MQICRLLIAFALVLFNLPAMAATYPAGTILSGGLAWQTPEATPRSWSDASATCAASTVGSVSGWRVPTILELTNLYFDRGSAAMAEAGWGSAWIWASNAMGGGHQVARMNNGDWSYSVSSELTTCVRTEPTPLTPAVPGPVLNWQLPDATNRTWTNAAAFCAASTQGGLTGWRLPTEVELSNLYYSNGNAALVAQGWPGSSWIWVENVYSSGHQVVRLSDGVWSYDSGGSYAVACVRDEQALPPGSFVSAGLVWTRPATALNTYVNADALCQASVDAGQTDWRLPTKLELSNLYFENGASAMASVGWTADWIWTSSVYSSGHQVVRMSDGTWSWGSGGSYAVSCVRTAPAAAPPVPLPSDTSLNSGGLVWSKPAALGRPWTNTVGYCSANTISNQTGWRLPTEPELTALYNAQGSSNMAVAGWPSDWIWTSTPYSTGNKVVRMSDGTWSWAVDSNADRYFVTCVKSSAAYTGEEFTSGGLSWIKTSALQRPWANSVGYCPATPIRGRANWRLPTKPELTALYADKGSSWLAAAGFASTWTWSSTPYSTGYTVVRISDGTWSWDNTGDASRYYAACVRDPEGMPAGTISSGGLTWIKPATLVRPFSNADSTCAIGEWGGYTDWRLPTEPEISALYVAKGATYMANAGWPTDWIWTATGYSTGYKVVKVSNGAWSWANEADSARYYSACVR